MYLIAGRRAQTPGDTETQKTPSNGTQQATPIDTSLDEVEDAFKEAVLEKMVHEDTEAASKEESFEEVVHEDGEAASKEESFEDVTSEKIAPPEAKIRESSYKKIGSLWFVLINGIWYSSLNVKQFQALIALYRILLHEHHDFFLASQHPSASPALKRLARKYSMPARMWRHDVHSFLEVLRKRHPKSQKHIDAFIILAYYIQSLLDETIPAFEET